MGRFVLICVSFVTLVFFSGCSTTRPASSPCTGSSMQGSESKAQVLESSVPASGVSGAESSSAVSSGATVSGVTAQTMTKKQVQEALKNAGYYDGNIDGKFGPKTKAAIKEFQKDMDLKIDGIAGRNTKEKLLKYLK